MRLRLLATGGTIAAPLAVSRDLDDVRAWFAYV